MKLSAMWLALWVVGAAGCVENSFTPATTMKFAVRPEGCYLDLIFDGQPPYAYVIIGRVATESTAGGVFAFGENNEAAVGRLKDEACRAGAHGLMKVGSESHGSYNGDGYSKSTNGSAVAFIYVDETGRPLPPPRGPSLIIHPGAYSAAPPPARPPVRPANPTAAAN